MMLAHFLAPLVGGLIGGFLVSWRMRVAALDRELRVCYSLWKADRLLTGIEIGEIADIKVAVVYSVLAKLETMGSVYSHWEELLPEEEHYLRRRMYQWIGGEVGKRPWQR